MLELLEPMACPTDMLGFASLDPLACEIEHFQSTYNIGSLKFLFTFFSIALQASQTKADQPHSGPTAHAHAAPGQVKKAEVGWHWPTLCKPNNNQRAQNVCKKMARASLRVEVG